MTLSLYSNAPHRAPCDLDLASGIPVSPIADREAKGWCVSNDDLRCYPQTGPLEALYARVVGCAPHQVCATAGADDAIDRICRVALAPGRDALWTEPGFSMFPHFVRLCGGGLDSIPWVEGPFPTEQYLGAVGEQTRLLILVSPQNPTGARIARSQVEVVLERYSERTVLLDEAYVEFDEHSCLDLLDIYSNLLIVRTLSKAYGCAGLRVGFVLGDPRKLLEIRAAGSPFPVAAPSMTLAMNAICADATPRKEYVARVKEERTRLCTLASGLGIKAQPSASNSVLWTTPKARWIHDALAGCGIAVRRWTEPERESQLRITCPGQPNAFARLERAIESALCPGVLLFDMDGVLIDVSKSYRRAIKDTAASFGVEVTDAQIDRLKAKGHANDDWLLTCRLLTQAGVELSLDQVTRRFETLYQGDESRAGLWNNERLLIAREALLALAERYPLGIVTGRPRCDALRTLRHFDIESCFSAVVCREDAPLKPSADPIVLALNTLRAKAPVLPTAWFVGDTPDDMVAARRADVVPIGYVPPGGEFDSQSEVLYRAGAGRVLRAMQEFLELLI